MTEKAEVVPDARESAAQAKNLRDEPTIMVCLPKHFTFLKDLVELRG
jgi:hypothetical protein